MCRWRRRCACEHRLVDPREACEWGQVLRRRQDTHCRVPEGAPMTTGTPLVLQRAADAWPDGAGQAHGWWSAEQRAARRAERDERRRRRKNRWTPGNEVRLLENGEE